MKKVLINAYTEKNLGDDMFIKHLCHRYPNICFYVLCKEQYETALQKISKLSVVTETDCIKQIKFNFQIIIGGSIFMQPVNKSIWKKYKIDKETKIRGIPTYIIGANFGPFSSKIFYLLYKIWFKTIDGIVFRDEYSYNLFKFDNMCWAPDILLDYTLPNVKTQKNVAISCIKQNKRSGLMHYDENIYFTKLAKFIEKYVEIGYTITLAAFSSKQEDNIAAKEIYNLLSKNAKSKTEIIIYEGDIEAFLEKFLVASYIIGTRFHSVILGWNYGIPTFPICYNEKLYHAIVSYKFIGNYININEIDTIDFNYVDFNRISKGIINKNYLKIKSRKHFESIDKVLKGDENYE